MQKWKAEAMPMLAIVTRFKRVQAVNGLLGSTLSPAEVDQMPDDEVEIARILYEEQNTPPTKGRK